MAKSKFIFSTGLESREGKLSFDDSTGNLTLTGSTVFSGSVKAHYTPSADEDLVTVEYLNGQISANDQLGELNDVTLSGVSDGHMLVYNTDVWENVAMSGDATMAADGAITISSEAVTNDMLEGSIANNKLAFSAITVTAGNGLSGGGSVSLGGTVSLAIEVDGSTIEIDSDTLRIPDSGVVTAKIADSNVTTAKIADLNVTTDKLAADAVTGAKLADDAVDSEHLVDGSVDNVHLAGNIASSKLAELDAFDTGDLAEGSNEYFTNARARAAVSVTDAGGDGSLAYNSASGVITYTGPSAAEARAHISAGGDLSYDSSTGEMSFTERTDAEVRGLVSVTDNGGDGSLSYDNSTGAISYTGPSAAEARAHFSAGTGVSLSDGEIAIGQAVATDSNVQFNNMTVDGNLTVNGDQFKIDGETVVMDDTLMEMGTVDKDAPTSATTKDLGLVMHRHDGSSASKVAMYWDESSDKFRMEQGVEESNGVLASGSASTLIANLEGDVVGDVTGDLTGNADTASALETARTLSISGDAAGSVSFDGSANADIEITIANDAIENSMLADDAVDSDQIADGAVDNVHLAGNIASSKLAELDAFDSDDLSEGSTNLYFTDARAQASGKAAISVTDAGGDGSLAYNSASGVITYTGPSAAEVRAHFDANNGVDLTSGTVSLDMNSLSGETVANAADSFAFIDATDNSTKKASLASLISGSAGSGLSYENGQLKLDASSGAIQTLNGTANEIEVSRTDATVTIGLPDDVTLAGDLTAVSASLSGDLTVAGDLFVQGSTVSVEATEVKIADATLVIASGSDNASLAAANGAGIKIGDESSPLASIIYDGADSFDVSDHMNLASGNEFKINDASILSADTLGSSVVNSSLTSVGTISTGEWNATPIATAYIADDAVTTAKIADANVTTDKLAADAVTNAKLADDAVATANIVDANVTTDKLADLGVTTAKLAADAVTNAKLADDAVQTENLVDANVTTDKLAADAVTNAKLADDAVQTANIVNANVTSAKIAADAIDGSKIADDAVDSEHLVDGSVDNAHLAGNIASSKLAELDAFDTDNLGEGSSNLYFSNARARAAVSVTDAGGDGSLAYNSASGVITYTGPSAAEARAHFSAGTGVSLTDGEISIGQAVATDSNVQFNNMTVDGNLTVNGDQFKVDGETVLLDDTLMEMGLASGEAPSSETTKDLGLVMHRHDGSSASKVAMYWDESADKFRMETGVEESAGILASGSAATLVADLEGNADSASALETARTLSISGDAAGSVSFDGSANADIEITIANGAVERAMLAADIIDGSKIEDDAIDSEHIADGSVDNAHLAGNIASSKLAELDAFDTDNLGEGSSNLYFSNARARAAVSAAGDLSYNSASGEFSFTERTDAEVRGLVSASGDLSYDSSTGVFSFTERTDAEVRGLVSVTDNGGDGSLSYDNSTGVISYTGPSAAEARAHFSAGTGVSLSDGEIAIGQAVATTDDVSFNKVTVSGSAGSHEISMHQASMIVKEVASMTSGSVVDSFDASSGGSAEYLISAKDASGNMQTNKLLVASDGTSSFVVEYGDVDSSGASGFIEFTSDVSGGNARLLINSNSSGGAVTVRFHKVEVLY